MTHDECLVIEDSPPGIVAARQADMRALGVTNTVDGGALRAAGRSGALQITETGRGIWFVG